MRRRIVPVVLAAILMVMAVPGVGDAQPATRQAPDSQARERALRAELEAATRTFVETRAGLEAVEERLQRSRRKSEELGRQLDQARNVIDLQAASMYRTNGLGLLATMLSDADNAAERMAFADFLIARQAQQREQALLVIEGHNAATREITAARNQQAALLSRQEAALRTLQERFAEAKRLADAERRRQARAAAERARAARREAAASSKPPAPPPGGDRPAPPDPVRPAPPPARPAPPPVRPAPPRRNVACPVGQPRTYIDSWGAARSGGRSHQGTDILAPYGTTVYAYVSGRISRAKVGGGLGGTVIYLQGDNGHEYYYAHLASFSVRTGQRVRVGQAIARNGSTGNAPPNAPHVHFEVHPGGGKPVNPYPYVRQACH